jgi:hypothetical protein
MMVLPILPVYTLPKSMVQRFWCNYCSRLVRERSKENIFFLPPKTNAYFFKTTQ